MSGPKETHTAALKVEDNVYWMISREKVVPHHIN